MSQSMPVKLSGELVDEARSCAKLLNRSITGQIEHWAAIGRAIESQLPGDALRRLLERVGGTMKISRVTELSQRQEIAAVLTEFLHQGGGDGAWLREISSRGVPLYGSEPGQADTLMQLSPDGTLKVLRRSAAASPSSRSSG